MIQQIFIIYHGDIARKKYIDNILNSTLLNRIPYEFIYSNSVTTKFKYTNQHLSYNEYNNIIDHYQIWSKIAENDNNNTYLILDDSLTVNKYDLKFMSAGLYIIDLVESIKNSAVMNEWDIINLYHNWIAEKQHEISINKYIDIPSNEKRGDKAYLISTNAAKKLLTLKEVQCKLSELFYKLQYAIDDNPILFAFSSKISIFIDDNTNPDINQYIKIYSQPPKPSVAEIDGIRWYITIIVLVNDDIVKDDYMRFIGVMSRYKYQVIPIYYNESFSDKQFIEVISKTIINFRNQHYKNTNVYENHIIMFMSTVLTYINCSNEQLIKFFIKMRKDILLSKPTINIKEFNIPDILTRSDIWMARLSVLYNAFIDNKTNISIGYDMNDDYIISIDDTKFISTEFEFDIKMNRFKCNVVNSINKYPFIFYSLKSYIARFIIHDIWNILPEKGNIIRTNPLISHEKNNNMLVALYIDNSGYKHLQSVGIDNWIKRFIDGQLLPYNLDDIDYIMYTDNIDIYNKLLKCKRYNVYHNDSIRNLWLNILKNYLVNYKYILWINGNILIDNIHMLYDLLMTDVSIITPHIVGKNNTTKSKCVDGISNFIIKRKVIGIWTVPHIQDVILMRNDSFNNLYETMLKYDFDNSTSFEKYICNCLMVCGYNMWYINTRVYGKDNRF